MFFDIQFSIKYQKMAEVIFGNFFLFAIMFNFRDFPLEIGIFDRYRYILPV